MNMTYREQRLFAFVVAIGILVTAWVFDVKDLSLWYVCLGFSATLVVVGLFLPFALRYPCVIWMRIGHCLGWLNTKILLSVFYLIILTPIGIVKRMLCKNGLDLRIQKDLESYYNPKVEREVEHYRYQF